MKYRPLSSCNITELMNNSRNMTCVTLPNGRIITNWYIEKILKHTHATGEPWPVKYWNGENWDEEGKLVFIPVDGDDVEDCRRQMKEYMQERGMIGKQYRLSRFFVAYTPYMPLFVSPATSV